jgi:hypothetical protein
VIAATLSRQPARGRRILKNASSDQPIVRRMAGSSKRLTSAFFATGESHEKARHRRSPSHDQRLNF